MEPGTWQWNDTRYKHFLYRAQVAEDTRFETTSLLETPIIVVVSHFEAEGMLPVNWTLVMRKEADGVIIFSNAMRKDWIFCMEDDYTVCLKTMCQADADCQHEIYLEFNSNPLAMLFLRKVQGAVKGCKIGSAWDDTVEETVDGLLSLVSETVDMDSMPKPPISLVVLSGDIGARSACGGLWKQLWEFVDAVYRGVAGLVFPGRG